MSALAAVVGPRGAPAGRQCERVLHGTRIGADPPAGRERSAVWLGDGAALGCRREPWQAAGGLGGPTLVAERGSVIVAADAALYYRAELRRAIAERGAETSSDDPAELIAAAYDALGDGFVAALEGDFAFVLWDDARRRLIAARDLGGRRPLYYAALGDTLVVASSVAGVLAHPRCAGALNLESLAETAAGLIGATAESCYRGVHRIDAAHALDHTAGGAVRVARHWEMPTFERPDARSFDDAASELRERLERAVGERLAPGGPTAVFMSGGWDSPPIFAAGRSALRGGAGQGGAVIPVSMSYPAGDPGREDEAIDAIAAHWGERPRWRDVGTVGLFGDAAGRAARRDEPLSHVYELWNRSLMEGARDAGARVALDGIGGDGLFQLSPVYLADLFARGRWATLAREWRGGPLRGSGSRALARWAVLPAIPPWLRPAVAWLRGGPPVRGYLDRAPPPWVRGAAVPAALAARGVTTLRRRPGESRAALESRWHFESPWAPGLLGALARVAAEYQLEPRSPYYDRRVIALAASRPRSERRAGPETKRLLRAAMHGLLPADTLAARAGRTGVTSGYFARAVRAELPAIVAAELRTVALADLGVVDADALRRAAAAVARDPASPLAVPLWFTLETEWWVRAHGNGAARGGGSV